MYTARLEILWEAVDVWGKNCQIRRHIPLVSHGDLLIKKTFKYMLMKCFVSLWAFYYTKPLEVFCTFLKSCSKTWSVGSNFLKMHSLLNPVLLENLKKNLICMNVIWEKWKKNNHIPLSNCFDVLLSHHSFLISLTSWSILFKMSSDEGIPIANLSITLHSSFTGSIIPFWRWKVLDVVF